MSAAAASAPVSVDYAHLPLLDTLQQQQQQQQRQQQRQPWQRQRAGQTNNAHFLFRRCASRVTARLPLPLPLPFPSLLPSWLHSKNSCWHFRINHILMCRIAFCTVSEREKFFAPVPFRLCMHFCLPFCHMLQRN